MNHLKHFSNFQLLSDVQAKDLDLFHTEALQLSDNFTPSLPFSEHRHFPHWSGFKKYVKCFDNFKLFYMAQARTLIISTGKS